MRGSTGEVKSQDQYRFITVAALGWNRFFAPYLFKIAAHSKAGMPEIEGNRSFSADEL